MPHAEVLAFLMQAVVISFSGVMAPGPVTAVTLALGSRNRHAGALVAIGHGIVEFPLMVLIILGIGRLFAVAGVRIGIGAVGGAMLLLMGAGMLRQIRKASEVATASPRRGPVLTGVVLSAGNPYFLLWWATVGLTLAARAAELGMIAFALFAMLHWLCDLVWLEVLSWSSFKGTKLFGDRGRKAVLAVCGAALLLFGVLFLYQATRGLVGLLR